MFQSNLVTTNNKLYYIIVCLSITIIFGLRSSLHIQLFRSVIFECFVYMIAIVYCPNSRTVDETHYSAMHLYGFLSVRITIQLCLC